MSNVLIEEQYLSDIADAIRGKNGSNQAYYPSEMAQAIVDIPSGGTVQYNVLCFTATEPNSTIYIQCNTSLNIKLQYSYDNQNWNDWSSSVSEDGQDVFSTISLTNAGDKVYVRGNNATMGTSSSVYSRFYMSGKISASGNIQSLLTYDGSYPGMTKYCYYSIFQNCTSLTTAPELPVTKMENNCYANMFYNCTSLTTAPELPATILTNNCYSAMFRGCTSLATAPELPATTLAANCYSTMFRDCKSLTVAPELPAITLESGCYSTMFRGCTSLVTAPELPATTLVSNCYASMFYGCTSLTYLKVYASKWVADYAANWVINVSAYGTFVKPSGTSIAVGTNGRPSGWTVENF